MAPCKREIWGHMIDEDYSHQQINHNEYWITSLHIRYTIANSEIADYYILCKVN